MLETSLRQTWEYADRSDPEQTHLVIFDRTPHKPWSEKIWRRAESYNGLAITVWGM